MPERSLSSRLLMVYAAAFLAAIAALGFVVDRTVRNAMVRLLVDDLAASAEFVSDRLSDDIAAQVAALDGIAGGARITVIHRDGTVLADTAQLPALMENHSDRPEVIDALAGSVGTFRRVSTTIDRALLYVAVPPAPGRDHMVRLAITEESIQEKLNAFRGRVLLWTVLVGLAGVGAVALVGRRLAVPIRSLTRRAQSIADGDLGGRSPIARVSELADLGHALDRMASHLQARIAEADEARAELEVILQALPVGVVAVGGDGELAYANPAAEKLLRGAGASLNLLMPAALRRALDRARTGEDATETVLHGAPARRLEISAFGFGVSSALALIVDTTEAERAESARRDFVASASHELKTPISAIRAASDALQLALDRDVDQARRFASMVSASTEQLTRLASDLLDLSRLEASAMEFGSVDLGAVAAQVASRLEESFRQRSVSLRVEVEPVTVSGSAADLELATRNLLDNALRYTDAGGHVVVTVVARDDQAVLEVEDSGVGIPTRALPRVFERFYRVDSARSRATGGTGLGLAIVKHVVERHGGVVSVASVLGSGSKFTVRLDRA